MKRENGCRVQADLVNQLTSLNGKLNTLSPHWVRSQKERDEIHKQRETLQVELKQHRTKGHNGKRCPSFDRSAVPVFSSS